MGGQGHRFLAPSLAVAWPLRDHFAYNIILLIFSSHRKAAQRSASPTPGARRVRPALHVFPGSRIHPPVPSLHVPLAYHLATLASPCLHTRRALRLPDPPADIDLLTAPASCSVMVVAPHARDWHSIDT